MSFERHQYPPMLGPLEAVPAGTPAWAERLGLRILNAVETTEQHGVDRLIPLVEMALEAREPKPWNVFPEGHPCRSPDKYLRYAAGVDCVSVAKLIAAYKGEDHPLVRRLRRCIPDEAQALAHDAAHGRLPELGDPKGGRPGNRDGKKRHSSHGSNSAPERVARLQRDHPDIVERLAAGEFRSVAEAVRYAQGETRGLTKLRRAWTSASPEEREAFLGEIVK